MGSTTVSATKTMKTGRHSLTFMQPPAFSTWPYRYLFRMVWLTATCESLNDVMRTLDHSLGAVVYLETHLEIFDLRTTSIFVHICRQNGSKASEGYFAMIYTPAHFFKGETHNQSRHGIRSTPDNTKRPKRVLSLLKAKRLGKKSGRAVEGGNNFNQFHHWNGNVVLHKGCRDATILFRLASTYIQIGLEPLDIENSDDVFQKIVRIYGFVVQI